MSPRLVLKTALGLALATAVGTAFVSPARANVVVSYTFGDIGATLNGANPANSTLVTVSGGVGIFPYAANSSHSLFVSGNDTTGLPHGNGTLADPVDTSVGAFPLTPGAVNFYKDWYNASGSIYYQVNFTSLALTSTPSATGFTGNYVGKLYAGTSPTTMLNTGQTDTMAMSIVDNGGPISVVFSDRSIPEPVSMSVLGMGILGLGLVRRHRA